MTANAYITATSPVNDIGLFETPVACRVDVICNNNCHHVSLNTNISDKSDKMTGVVSDCDTSLVDNYSCDSHILEFNLLS